jgi:hypothetical protein
MEATRDIFNFVNIFLFRFIYYCIANTQVFHMSLVNKP